MSPDTSAVEAYPAPPAPYLVSLVAAPCPRGVQPGRRDTSLARSENRDPNSIAVPPK